MTTSNFDDGLGQLAHLALNPGVGSLPTPAGSLPAGFPDVASLSRMANEFFSGHDGVTNGHGAQAAHTPNSGDHIPGTPNRRTVPYAASSNFAPSQPQPNESYSTELIPHGNSGSKSSGDPKYVQGDGHGQPTLRHTDRRPEAVQEPEPLYTHRPTSTANQKQAYRTDARQEYAAQPQHLQPQSQARDGYTSRSSEGQEQRGAAQPSFRNDPLGLASYGSGGELFPPPNHAAEHQLKADTMRHPGNAFAEEPTQVGTMPFGFLANARSLSSYVPAGPVNAVPEARIPTENDFGAGRLSAPILPEQYDVSSPQTGGAPGHPEDLSPPLGFLSGLNPIEPQLHSGKGAPGGVGFGSSPYETFDVQTIRRDFPILQERVKNGRQLIWLDNAATTHKPQAVIDRLAFFYAHENSNIHRAAHTLAARSTDAYEGAREKVRRFMNAPSATNIIFVRGATEGINLVAQTWGRRNIQKDDEIVLTNLEHHANIVPWQMLCAEKGSKLRVAPVDDSGQIILEEYEKLFNARTKLVAFPHVSNALGTITPVKEMVEIAHRFGAVAVVDGAQSIAHTPVNVQDYDCDFYIFSGHKMFAPTGIGVVYGKQDVLEHMPPWQGGGNMIADVTFEKTVYQGVPGRFEAGTGNIADAVGLGAAIDYLERIGMVNIERYEHDLLQYGMEVLRRIPGVRLIGTAKDKASVLSFVLDGYKTEEVGAALNSEGIAVRSGHHCAQPILRRFGLETTVRPSLAFYNTCDEIDALATAIWNLKSGRNPGL